MKKLYIIFIVMVGVVGIIFLLRNNLLNKNTAQVSSIPAENNQAQIPSNNAQPQNNNVQNSNGFVAPLDRALERVTKKPFGIFITPKNSPVQPEKFRGYHTGTDFEIFPGEENIDIPVKAVCSGKLEMKKIATGYGGVAVESCELNGSPITVIYGHLKLSSIAKNAGDDLKVGDTIGILGAGYSVETNGERKHLHLGFHKGTTINILGYVQNQSELTGWINSCMYVCQK
jgi:murein DD-endopeptidase MepM/ murein hydrolase activator NlpD